MKLAVYLIIGLALAFGWIKFLDSNSANSDEGIQKELIAMEEAGETEEAILEREKEMQNADATNKFTGLLLGFLTAGFVGVLFVTTILPAFVDRATTAVFESNEQVGDDPMREARSQLAQGEYDAAIEAFQRAAAAEPMNRVPYIEIAKVQLQNQENPDAAIATLTSAIEGQSWEENDAAFLMFRLAEIYKDNKNDIANASAVMQQVVEQFPATRHSANAQHKMREWSGA